MKRRYRIEGVFGWGKTVGGIRHTKLRGLGKVGIDFVFQLVAKNVVTARSLRGMSAPETRGAGFGGRFKPKTGAESDRQPLKRWPHGVNNSRDYRATPATDKKGPAVHMPPCP